MKTSKLSSACQFTAVLLALIVVATDADPAQAQRGRRGDSLLDLARDRDLREELKLTDEQADSIEKIRSESRSTAFEKYREFGGRIEAAKDDAEKAKIEAERREYFDGQRKIAEAALAKVISAEQLRGLRLSQLKRRGVRGVGAEWGAVELKLTDEQKTKLQATISGHDQQRQSLDEARRELFRNRDLSREERDKKSKALQDQGEALGKQRDQAILGVLSETQKTSFQTLAGLSDAEDSKSVDKPMATASPPDSTPKSATKSADATSQRGATVVTADGKPVSGSVVASFGAGVDATGAKPAKSLQFNFVQAPWSDVLKMFSAAAGLTWDQETVPPGTFTYFDDKDYTPTQALNVLNGALLQKGFILLRRDRFAVVVNVDNPVPPNLIPTVTVDELAKRASSELVRVVMPLEGKDAAKAATEVAYLLGPQGKAVALSVANSLIVTGMA